MNNTNTGGLAFPQCSYNTKGGYDITGGASLRDYFAAKAMQAYMEDGIHENDFAWCACHAYKVADAMLKARKA